MVIIGLRMNHAVKGVIQQKIRQQGFAANDSRFTATVSAVGAGVTAAATAIVAGATWPAVLAGAGISAIVSYAIPLVADKAVSWWFNDQAGTISVELQKKQLTEVVIGDEVIPITHKRGIGCTISYKHYVRAIGYANYNSMEVLPHYGPVPSGFCHSAYRPGSGLDYFAYASVVRFSNDERPKSRFFGMSAIEPGVNDFIFMSGEFPCEISYDKETNLNIPDPLFIVELVPDSSTTTIHQGINNLSQEILMKPLSAEMLAAAANTIWFAAKPNSYNQIIPWNPSDAITAEDAKRWLMANPNNAPLLSDFIAPATLSASAAQSNPSDSPKITPQPKSAIEPETNRQNERKPTPDLVFSPAPDIDAPDLEAIPTANMILAPLLNLMSDLKNFSVPSHPSVCPTASFSVLGREYHWNTHCGLIEQHRLLSA